MGHTTHRDLKLAVDLIGAVSVHTGPRALGEEGVRRLPGLVGSEVTTLSVCTLTTGHRRVSCNPDGAISAGDIACFDRHFYEHPLVRYHASNPDGASHRISDSLAPSAFRRSAVYNEYYRSVGIEHAIAVPLFVDSSLLVSFVLNRTGRDFSERDREVLDLIRRPLAALYRNALALDAARRAQASAPADPDAGSAAEAVEDGARAERFGLTEREREILYWVAAGKTNPQIAEILEVSTRTIGKHLEHIYAKLGVETRTAAVNRAFGRAAVRRNPPAAPSNTSTVPSRSSS